MLKRKIPLFLLIVILVLIVICFTIERKNVDSEGINTTAITEDPMMNLEIDTNYVHLDDINPNLVIERSLNKDEIINNGVIIKKKKLYEKILKDESAFILESEDGYFISATETNGILITKYDENGNEVKSKAFGSSDMNFLYDIKLNKNVGIVFTAISDSYGGPVITCIDYETFELKWEFNINNVSSSFVVSDDGVFVLNDEVHSSLVKLNNEGKTIWNTSSLSQWVHSVVELNSGDIVVSQNNIGDNKYYLITFNKDGEEILNIPQDCFGELTKTDDGGFIMVSIRNKKTVPQPVYVSAIWFDTETVVTKYDKDCNIQWRKTFDKVKDAVHVDSVIPQRDGSLVVVDE